MTDGAGLISLNLAARCPAVKAGAVQGASTAGAEGQLPDSLEAQASQRAVMQAS